MHKSFFAVLLLLCLGACATTQAGPNGLADRDPREGFNRNVWAVNEAIDSAAIEPVAALYRTITPQPARRGVSNLFSNLSEPWSLVNNVLQGNPDRAIRNLGRFIVNSTVGIAGLIDVASEIGIEAAPEDFGQTLAVWGVGDGGYSVSPLLGPTTARGTVGTIVGFIANPTTIFLDRVLGFGTIERLALTTAEIVSGRAEAIDTGADAFLDSSADPYAAARAAFFTSREAAILNYDTAGLSGDRNDIEATEDEAFEAALDDLEQESPLGQPDTEEPDPGEPDPAEPEPVQPEPAEQGTTAEPEATDETEPEFILEQE